MGHLKLFSGQTVTQLVNRIPSFSNQCFFASGKIKLLNDAQTTQRTQRYSMPSDGLSNDGYAVAKLTTG
jgi:hypothetical protein